MQIFLRSHFKSIFNGFQFVLDMTPKVMRRSHETFSVGRAL